MNCPGCGFPVPTGSLFCGECGQRTMPAPVTCPKCSAQMGPAAKFCGRCGGLLVRSSAPLEVLPAAVLSCHQCGSAIERGEAFCGECGTAVRSSAPPPAEPSGPVYVPRASVPPPARPERVAAPRAGSGSGWGSWKALTHIGSGAMIVGFFLPWVMVSCDMQAAQQLLGGAGAKQLAPSAGQALVFKFSGYQLAAGSEMGTGAGAQRMQGSPSLWLFLAAAVVASLVVLFIARRRVAACVVLLAGLVSLAPVFRIWQSFTAQQNPLVKISPEFGLWIALLGVAGLFAGGLLGLRLSHDEQPAASRPESSYAGP